MEERKTTDAFTFVDNAGEAAFENAQSLYEQNPHVRYSIRLSSGPYDIFLAIEVDEGDLKTIEDIALRQLRAPGSTSTDTVLSLRTPCRVKRSTAFRYEAFIRIRVLSDADPWAVEHRLEHLIDYYASDPVQGSYHILLEMADDEFPRLQAAVEKVRDIEGVASYVPCYAEVRLEGGAPEA
jgi:hypothetical protein